MNNATTNILSETTDLFQSAIALLEYRHLLSIQSEDGPSGYQIDAQEYRNGLTFIKSAIIGNRFVNQEARNIVQDAVLGYRRMIPVEHKLTAKRIDLYLERVFSTEDNLFSGNPS